MGNLLRLLAIGLMVPGLLGCAMDRITLKKGDVLTGTVVTDAFSIQSDYTKLTFDRGRIDSICLGFRALSNSGRTREAGTDYVKLRNGDVINGRLLLDTLEVRLADSQALTLEKDLIEEIEFRRRAR